MAPFRPNNINKRAYPGNANIIGPTCTATLGLSTTTCCSSTASFGACVLVPATLGCRCCCCHCPCCNICCSCPCTVCTRTTPGGMYKLTQQYDARIRDAWGDSSCSSAPATCLCCTNVGFSCVGSIVDFGGNYICGASSVRWIVAPSSSEVSRSWYTRNDAITRAQQVTGCTGWFIPSASQLQNPGHTCRTYWDSFSNSCYWSESTTNQYRSWTVSVANNSYCCYTFNPFGYCVRAFRCVSY